MSTMRESENVELVRVRKEVRTQDDKRVHFDNGNTAPVEIQIINGKERVFCGWCKMFSDSDSVTGFNHIRDCKASKHLEENWSTSEQKCAIIIPV
jgi:hypothetical protein